MLPTSADQPAPRGNVLLISCMDLRLIDDTVRFMDSENLTNRYDQFILAGAALGAATREPWNAVLFEHLQVACDLHQVRDVYILEHRNCGAYKVFLGAEGDFNDSPEAQEAEHQLHQHYARQLAEQIRAWAEAQQRPLQVRCFMMNLRGQVEPLLADATT